MRCVSGTDARLALAALLCAVSLARAHDARPESESEIVSPAPFTLTARYGRAAHGGPQRLITPRNGRWMMTTRYGKRSESAMEPPLPPPPPGGTRPLHCEYTGVPSLYRCIHVTSSRAWRPAPAQGTLYARRHDDDSAPEPEPEPGEDR